MADQPQIVPDSTGVLWIEPPADWQGYRVYDAAGKPITRTFTAGHRTKLGKVAAWEGSVAELTVAEDAKVSLAYPEPPPTPKPTGSEGHVGFCMSAATQSDDFIRNADATRRAWINAHWTRAICWSSFADSRLLPWYKHGLPYQDAYAIYCSPSDTVPPTHKEWVLRDASGKYLKFYAANQFMADIGNPAWVADFVNRAKTEVAKGYPGVYIDDANLDLPDGNPINPRTGQPYTEDQWATDMVLLIEAVAAAIPGRELMINKVWFDTPNHDSGTALSKRMVGAATRVVIERGFSDTGVGSGTGQWSTDRYLKYADAIHGQGASITWLANTGDASKAEYNLAGALLVNDGDDYVYVNGTWMDTTWFAKYDVDLGAAKGPRAKSGEVFRRDFVHGYVTLDPVARVGKVVVT